MTFDAVLDDDVLSCRRAFTKKTVVNKYCGQLSCSMVWLLTNSFKFENIGGWHPEIEKDYKNNWKKMYHKEQIKRKGVGYFIR